MKATLDPRIWHETADDDDDLETLLSEGVNALVCDGDLLLSRRRFETAYEMAERSGDACALARRWRTRNCRLGYGTPCR